MHACFNHILQKGGKFIVLNNVETVDKLLSSSALRANCSDTTSDP